MKRRFRGPMGSWMKRHLKLRRSLGFVYDGAEYSLDEFDRYLKKRFPKCKTITREMVVSYLETTKNVATKTRAGRVTCLRQFCRFMLQFDPDTYIPETGLVPPAVIQVKPYIFSEADVIKLMTFARQMAPRPPLLPHTYETMIGLLWTTGLRIGEVVRLNIEDVDLEDGILCIKQTKFFKSRLVPLSPSVVEALREYKDRRNKAGHSPTPDAPFFVNRRRKRCITATAPRTIKGLIRYLGFKNVQGRYARVHDLRHAFATRWLGDLYRTGKDPTAYLPVLATYLGHANIANTQTYLHPSKETLSGAGEKFNLYVKGKNK